MKPSRASKKINKTALSALRRQLRRLNDIYSWGEMSEQIYEGTVSRSVLHRIATDKRYTPADEQILTALDLYRKPNPYRILPRWFKRTPEALEYVNTKREQIRQMGRETRRAAKR